MAIVLSKDQELCASLRPGDVIRLRGWLPTDARGQAMVISEGTPHDVRVRRASMSGDRVKPEWSTYPTRVSVCEIAGLVIRAQPQSGEDG